MSRSRLSIFGLCALMVSAGVMHFVAPTPYRRIVPAPLRGQAAGVVAVSGVCEVACAALLALPRTRRFGAWATAALFVAVFPANVQMALDSGHADASTSHPLYNAALAWLRLPLQLPLILWALSARRP
ncbi:MAG: hypothetical protein LC769_10575 [Chloroflexi bacterium]|nr:hypothetical protein [Chloroflexota bacterium]